MRQSRQPKPKLRSVVVGIDSQFAKPLLLFSVSLFLIDVVLIASNVSIVIIVDHVVFAYVVP